MVTQELLVYLRAQQAAGMPPSEMERLLVTEGGWDKAVLLEAFAILGITVIANTAPLIQAPPQINTPEVVLTAKEPLQVNASITPETYQRREEAAGNSEVAATATLPPNNEDDFLGIFSNSPSPATPATEPFVAQPNPSLIATPPVTSASAPIADKVIERGFASYAEVAPLSNFPQVSSAANTTDRSDPRSVNAFSEERVTSPLSPSNRKNAVLVLAIAVFLLVFGSAAAGYFFLANRAPKPEVVFAGMLHAMKDVHSYAFTMKSSIDISAKPSGEALQMANAYLGKGSEGALKLALNTTGATIMGETATSSQTDVTYDMDGNARYGAVSIILDGGANIRTTDGKVYFRITKIPQLLAMTGMSSMIAEWKDKWISFDTNATSSLSSMMNMSVKSSVPTTLTPGDREKVLQIFEKDFPIELSVPKDDSAVLGGVEVYHYRFTVEKNKLASLLTELSALYGKQSAEQDPDVLKKSIDTAVELFASTTGELYVGKKDSYLYRTNIRIPIDLATSSVQVSGAIDIEMNASSFNTVAPITAPNDTTSIEDVYADIMKKAMGSDNMISRTAGVLSNGTITQVPPAQYSLTEAQLKSRDAKRISDIGQIQLALELYFDAHQHYPSALSPLTKEKFLPMTLTDPLDHKEYMYASLKKGMSYALGASLEYSESSVLPLDADQSIKEFTTSDLKGCRGETGRYCYDIKE